MRLTMLEPADRPPQYSDILFPGSRAADGDAKGHFKVLPNWNYFDDETQCELKWIFQELLDPELQSPFKQGRGSDAIR